MRKVLALLLVSCSIASAQFKGGSLHWERVAHNSNIVRVTLRASWIRSSGTFVKIVDGIAQPSEGYQPVKGDVVNVLGYETPKFLFSTGFESYLQLEVTSNTEAVNDQYDFNAGLNLPHFNDHWSHNASNWIDGVASWDMEIPDPDLTYIAEVQGCCRDQEWDGFNIRYARGLRDMFSTPYHLTTVIRLDLDPPPLSFLPFFVPFQTQQSAEVLKFPLPILDYRATASGSAGSRDEPAPRNWVDLVMEAGETHVSDEPFDAHPLYPIAIPAPVIASAAITGTSLRFLNNPSQRLKLFSSSGEGAQCEGTDYVELPPGADLCDGSGFDELHFPSGGAVMSSVGAVMVPEGVMVEITDACEFSQPPMGTHSTGTFEHGAVRKTCMAGCCALTAAEAAGAVMFRARSVADTEASTKVLLQTVQLANGYYQVELEGGALGQGNYPVTLKLATNGSAWTTVEFTLHVMNSVGQTLAETVDTTPVTHAPSPVGFRHAWEWHLAPETFVTDRKFFFDNLGQRGLFGPTDAAPRASLTSDLPRRWEAQWTPCDVHRGYYYYCVFGLSAEPPYDWAPIKCAFINVVGDKPPRLTMHPFNATSDQVRYSVYMGQSLDVVARVIDNPSDSILELGVSKIDVNNGDKHRARVAYVYEDVSTATVHELALMPVLVQPALPPFLGLAVGGPLNETYTALNPHTLERVVTFVPSRMHSGLELTMCFLAIDARGACPRELPGSARVGDGTERCLVVSVHRCKYAMSPGQHLPHVAGLFETSWLQLFSLNPLLTTPEVPADTETIVNIGHRHVVGEGQYLDSVVRRFGTSLRDLSFVNAELSERMRAQWEGALAVGTELCVIPNSCATHV